MRMRGRRHWTERVTVLVLSAGGQNPEDPMGDPLPSGWNPDPDRVNIPAVIQSMDRESILKAGLESTEEAWFVRIEPGARITQQDHRIRWHSEHEGDIDLTPAGRGHVNAIPYKEDIELVMVRAQTTGGRG